MEFANFDSHFSTLGRQAGSFDRLTFQPATVLDSDSLHCVAVEQNGVLRS